MITISGIGCWSRGQAERLLTSSEAPGEGQAMFSGQFRNFGRLDADSKAAAYAVALTLTDAGIKYPLMPETVAGMAGGSSEGCLTADVLYFRDYLDEGRTLGRGNYFIYTLPTSPLAECAIHFGLAGPVLYTAGSNGYGGGIALALSTALSAIEDGQAGLMLAGGVSGAEAMFMAVGKSDGPGIRPGEMIAKLEGAASYTEARALLKEI